MNTVRENFHSNLEIVDFCTYVMILAFIVFCDDLGGRETERGNVWLTRKKNLLTLERKTKESAEKILLRSKTFLLLFTPAAFLRRKLLNPRNAIKRFFSRSRNSLYASLLLLSLSYSALCFI